MLLLAQPVRVIDENINKQLYILLILMLNHLN